MPDKNFELLKYLHEEQRDQLAYRRNREFQIFTWSTTLLLATVGILLVKDPSKDGGRAATPGVLRWVAVALIVATVAVTLVVNVPINRQTAQWNPLNPPPDWQLLRNRWERFQAIRSMLLLLGFSCLVLAAALR